MGYETSSQTIQTNKSHCQKQTDHRSRKKYQQGKVLLSLLDIMSFCSLGPTKPKQTTKQTTDLLHHKPPPTAPSPPVPSCVLLLLMGSTGFTLLSLPYLAAIREWPAVLSRLGWSLVAAWLKGLPLFGLLIQKPAASDFLFLSAKAHLESRVQKHGFFLLSGIACDARRIHHNKLIYCSCVSSNVGK